MTWDDYEAWLGRAWLALLDGAPPEREVQEFLECHPCLVPGGEGGDRAMGGHHGAFPQALFSQPALPGLTKPVPDFMWITKVSGEVWPVLIEIERPGKRWFNGSGVTSGDLVQAIDQLAVWKDWFQDEDHRLQFFRLYRIDEHLRRYHVVDPRFCLIYGRRSEFADDPTLSRKRGGMAPDWLNWMTYDRLRPHPWLANAITVRRLNGAFRVVAVPPTFRWGPNTADLAVAFEGWPEAIERGELMTSERKAFLRERLPYWRQWEQRGRGLRRPGDFE
jgi:hypothetical protein